MNSNADPPSKSATIDATAANANAVPPDFLRAVSEAVAPLVPLAEAFRKGTAEMARRIEDAIAPFRTPEFTAWVVDAARRFLEISDWLENAPESLRAALEDAGMVPHPDLSLSDLVKVLNAFHRDGRGPAVAALNGLHEELFADATFRTQLIARWSADKRAHVLQQILQAHDADLFATSIPTALAQAEGIVADTLGHRGAVTQSILIEHATGASHPLYRPVVAHFITKFLFARFRHGDPLPPFSRHAILHGADTEYGTKERSLRALVWLDFLVLLAYARTE